MNKNVKFELIIKPEEQPGSYQFNGEVVMTANFAEKFGGQIKASRLIMKALNLISKEINEKGGVDYFRVFHLKRNGEIFKTFWAMDDIEYVTFLMPEDK